MCEIRALKGDAHRYCGAESRLHEIRLVNKEQAFGMNTLISFANDNAVYQKILAPI